jgi:hypothetical protein
MSKEEKFLKAIMATNGEPIELDISDEACLMFGFKHGDRIVNGNGQEATFMGVAKNPCQCLSCLLNGFVDRLVPWLALDEHEGRVGKVQALGNLRNYGLVLKSEAEEAEKMPDPVEALEIMTLDGQHIFKVDISETACMQCGGFKHGDRILCPTGDKATVMGVASMNAGKKYGKKVLWFNLDDGGICYLVDPEAGETDLKKQGFTLLEDEKK